MTDDAASDCGGQHKAAPLPRVWGEELVVEGLTYRCCAHCGFRDGPIPQEILGHREGAP
jgi:hypothetical protein